MSAFRRPSCRPVPLWFRRHLLAARCRRWPVRLAFRLTIRRNERCRHSPNLRHSMSLLRRPSLREAQRGRPHCSRLRANAARTQGSRQSRTRAGSGDSVTLPGLRSRCRACVRPLARPLTATAQPPRRRQRVAAGAPARGGKWGCSQSSESLRSGNEQPLCQTCCAEMRPFRGARRNPSRRCPYASPTSVPFS